MRYQCENCEEIHNSQKHVKECFSCGTEICVSCGHIGVNSLKLRCGDCELEVDERFH